VKLLDRIRSHLNARRLLAVDRRGKAADIELEAATAILLLEAAYGDEEYAWSEHRVLLRALERGFGLGKKETLSLLDRAEEIRPPIVSLDDVTDVLVDRFNVDQRQEVIALIWKVIDADDIVEEWEESFANHIAEAVGLSPGQAQAARARAD
jgi:uncharacterized tellurite resistance protein B-like protein